MVKIAFQLNRLKSRQKALIENETPVEDSKLILFYTRILTKVTNSEKCSVYIHDPKKGTVWLKAGTGFEERSVEVPLNDSVAGESIVSGKTIVVSDINKHPSTGHKKVEELTGFVTRNILCVPIKSPTQNKVTGAFQLVNKENDQDFTDEDVSLAEEIAEHLRVETDQIFLAQEAFGLIDQFYSAPGKIATFVLASVVLLFLFSILLLTTTGVLAILLG